MRPMTSGVRCTSGAGVPKESLAIQASLFDWLRRDRGDDHGVGVSVVTTPSSSVNTGTQTNVCICTIAILARAMTRTH